jgi:selenocysteine lyase/cysteine desulfurase
MTVSHTGPGRIAVPTEYAARFCAQPGYLDFARFGPPSLDVLAATERALRQAARVDDDAGTAEVLDAQAEATTAVARHLGTAREHVAFSPSTSAALFQIAFALPPTGQLLVWRDEFPANVYPWLRAAQRGGPGVRLMSGPVTPDAVAAALDPTITAVAVSAVDFRTGRRTDLPALRELVGNRLLLVDGIQAFGAVQEDWSLADVLAVGGQKWLRAGWGNGFLALSGRALDRLDNAGLSGWTGVRDPVRYDGAVHDLASGADRFSLTNSSPSAAAALTAALRLVDDIGVTTIARGIVDRATALIEVLTGVGADVLTPTAPGQRAGIVSFSLPGTPAADVGRHLAGRGLTVTAREDHLRASVHASTPPEVIDRVGEALSAAAVGGAQ